MTVPEPDITVVYTDGACSGNPGPGGWAAILRRGTDAEILQGSEGESTNNRMELTAVIEALSASGPGAKLVIHTDSSYVVNGVTQWMEGWKAKGWKKVKNVDLWRRLDELLLRSSVEFRWVKGHAGDERNEEADLLARRALLAGVAARGEDKPSQPAEELFTEATGTVVLVGFSCPHSVGPGAWAAILRRGTETEELQGCAAQTTGNRMALVASIAALEALEAGERAVLCTNSNYVAKGVNDWMEGWKARGWNKVKNDDLWRRLDALLGARDVEFRWLSSSDKVGAPCAPAFDLARRTLASRAVT